MLAADGVWVLRHLNATVKHAEKPGNIILHAFGLLIMIMNEVKGKTW
jgi:hypothetical protein